MPKSVAEKAVKELTKALADKGLKKKERKRLEYELASAQEAIAARRATEEAPAKKKGGKKALRVDSPSSAFVDATTETWAVKAEEPKAEVVSPEELEERRRYGAAKKYLAKHGHPGQPGPDDIDRSDPELVAAYNLVVGKPTGLYITSDAEKAERDKKLAEEDAEIKARIQVKRAERAEKRGAPVAEVVEQVQEQVEAIDEKVRNLADPEEQQPRDRWGRPEILPPDSKSMVGYRRVTTFIDPIDDKSNLTQWGKRVVVTGVAAIEQRVAGEADLADVPEAQVESVLERVVLANRNLAKAVKKADKSYRKGDVDAKALAAAHDAAEREHKDTLNALVEEAYQAGDGYLKAETGTRIHKLTELHDTGQPMPEDVNESELRDVAAYAEACEKLGVKILAVEQFVVRDDLQIAGTLDRRLSYDSPTLGRRITVIGDVKTGSVDYGAGKMARQLSAYAGGKGYDFREPEKRVTFRTNQEVGLIFHLPAGSGTCTVYEVDLKKGQEGLRLCKSIYDHRSETTKRAVFQKVS